MIPLTGFSVEAWDHEYPPPNTDTMEWSPQDLNVHHGGKFVYVGMHYEKDHQPVTSINFLIQDYAGPHTPAHWESIDVDINSGVGGKYIYLIWRTGEVEKQPIFKIIFIESKRKSPPYYKGWNVIYKDLCAGAGGSYIYAYYK
ncbi:194_t:CDS:1 [Cetraspora pellucida]|uniref:194_t:CDS:1 n=1 Tax=Cetraspora pellucida TaxID=1433469 RepID=A0A9N8VXD0_9GLOM|nr:194_t:CDS:1 [Cetraspora pellucida]